LRLASVTLIDSQSNARPFVQITACKGRECALKFDACGQGLATRYHWKTSVLSKRGTLAANSQQVKRVPLTL